MSTNRIILFDSRDGKQLDSTNEIEFDNQYVINQINKSKINYIAVMSVEIPNTMYNISIRNNMLRYSWGNDFGNGDETITITPGFYTIDTLLPALRLALEPRFPAVLVTIDPNNILTINIGGNHLLHTIRILFSQSTMARVLGFIDNSASGRIISGHRAIDLRGVTSVLVKSNIPTQAICPIGNRDIQNNWFLHETKIDMPWGSTVFDRPGNPIIFKTSKLPNPIRFSMVNRVEETIDLNEFDWKLSLLVNTEY